MKPGVTLVVAFAAALSVVALRKPAVAPAPPAPAKAETPPGENAETSIAEYRRLYGSAPARTLVVLLPDPVALGSRADFDALLEGVDEAVAQGANGASYVRDRSFFPWPEEGTKGSWQKQPGVAIYRPSREDVPPFFVFIVGETPTQGVWPAELEEAVRLARAEARCQTCPVSIVGPTFSGTARSLAATLAKLEPPFAIATGTATHPDVTTTFAGWNFQSVIPSDDERLDEVVAYLAQRGGTCENIVLFTESGTLYGAQPPNRCVRMLKFPPTLSTLASADNPHALDLHQLLRDLAHSRVRFVGIAATASQDVVRLAGLIRGELPDVRLFTLGSDLGFLSETNAEALNGMLVIHGAPLHRRALGAAILEAELVRNEYRAARALIDRVCALSTPVIISFIGNGVLWQLEPEDGHRRAPLSWSFALGLFVFGFLAVVAVVFVRDRRIARRPGWSWMLARPCVHADLENDDRALMAALLVVSASAVILFLVAADRSPWKLYVGGLGAVSIVAVLFVLLGRDVRRASIGTRVLAALAAMAAMLASGLACGPPRAATFSLLSGGSPVLVGLIGLTSFAVALWCSHVRLHMLDSHRFESTRGKTIFTELAPPLGRALDPSLCHAEEALLGTLLDPWRDWLTVGVVWALYGVSLAVPWFVKSPQTFEAGWRNFALVAYGSLATLPAIASLTRFLTSWIRVRVLLRHIAILPASAALGKLPPRLARTLDAQLTVRSFDDGDLAHLLGVVDRLAAALPELAAERDRCRALFQEVVESEGRCLLSPSRARLVDGVLGLAQAQTARRATLTPEARELLDELGAVLIAIFVPRYLRHFRLFVPQLILGSVASLFMTSLYFVQPARLIGTIVFLWIVVITAVLFVAYVSFELDPVMSGIAKTPPNRISSMWPIVQRLVGLAILPAASLLSIQHLEFPFWLSKALDVLVKALN